jgi:hypothetical protein
MTLPMSSAEPVAAGFHFQPLLDGNVQIEFFDEADQHIGTQVITRDVLDSFPFVVALTQFAMSKGKVSSEVVHQLNDLIRGRS